MREEVKTKLIKTLVYIVPAALGLNLLAVIFLHPLIYVALPLILIDIALLICVVCRKSDEELGADKGAQL